jgi:hypothetical protein
MPQARANEKKIRAHLSGYTRPVQFHEVRTRFLGNIARPTPWVIAHLDDPKPLGRQPAPD